MIWAVEDLDEENVRLEGSRWLKRMVGGVVLLEEV